MEFAEYVRKYIYQVAAHEITDVTNHHALPNVIYTAVVTQNSLMAHRLNYLKNQLYMNFYNKNNKALDLSLWISPGLYYLIPTIQEYQL